MTKSVLLAALLSWPLVGLAQNNIDSGAGWIAAANASVNGQVFDQVVISGSEIVVHADPGQTLRLSGIDPSGDIFQAELSGVGSLHVRFDPRVPLQTGITQPDGYLQDLSGTPGYAKGLPLFTLTGTQSDTSFKVYSVGPANGNPVLFDATHQGGQDVGNFKGHVVDAGFIVIRGNAIHSVLLGNVRAQRLSIGAPVVSRAVIHGQADYDWGTTYLYSDGTRKTYQGFLSLAPGSTLHQDNGALLIAGGNLLATVANEGVATLKSQDGTDSAGNLQPAQTLTSQFFNANGSVNPTILY